MESGIQAFEPINTLNPIRFILKTTSARGFLKISTQRFYRWKNEANV
ncbi:hypothetical protein LEP1GSC133_1095 [Leptospira borgpetersenii serovar Pomona str. 200901868]|uniref:Uncharacterized protein n=1 Tax=Leptospira borgpetersenii serovar Pomona str. 200901868 TaxID=1192866 RepID=M6W9J0_LEPBO|nr:hypothetical protein LEP1GSC133_1095 [Leptospira borgpetersenii serovar Pomona str. 200901868]